MKGGNPFGAALARAAPFVGLAQWVSPRVGNPEISRIYKEIKPQMKHLILFESYSSGVKQKETVGAITVSLVPNPQDGDFSIELSSVVKGEAPKSKNKWLLGLFKSEAPSEEVVQTLRIANNLQGAEEAFRFALQKARETQDVSVVFDALVGLRNRGEFLERGDEEESDYDNLHPFKGYVPEPGEGEDEDGAV